MSQVDVLFPDSEPENVDSSAGKENSDNVLQLAQELIQALDVESDNYMKHISAEAKLHEKTESST